MHRERFVSCGLGRLDTKEIGQDWNLPPSPDVDASWQFPRSMAFVIDASALHAVDFLEAVHYQLAGRRVGNEQPGTAGSTAASELVFYQKTARNLSVG